MADEIDETANMDAEQLRKLVALQAEKLAAAEAQLEFARVQLEQAHKAAPYFIALVDRYDGGVARLEPEEVKTAGAAVRYQPTIDGSVVLWVERRLS
jgi:hypothetical protein